MGSQEAIRGHHSQEKGWGASDCQAVQLGKRSQFEVCLRESTVEGWVDVLFPDAGATGAGAV